MKRTSGGALKNVPEVEEKRKIFHTHLLDSIVLSALTFASETWTSIKQDNQRSASNNENLHEGRGERSRRWEKACGVASFINGEGSEALLHGKVVKVRVEQHEMRRDLLPWTIAATAYSAGTKLAPGRLTISTLAGPLRESFEEEM